MFEIIFKNVHLLLTSIANACNYRKCVSLSYQKWEVQLTLNDLSNKICVPSKTEYYNLSTFNIIKRINK